MKLILTFVILTIIKNKNNHNLRFVNEREINIYKDKQKKIIQEQKQTQSQQKTKNLMNRQFFQIQALNKISIDYIPQVPQISPIIQDDFIIQTQSNNNQITNKKKISIISPNSHHDYANYNTGPTPEIGFNQDFSQLPKQEVIHIQGPRFHYEKSAPLHLFNNQLNRGPSKLFIGYINNYVKKTFQQELLDLAHALLANEDKILVVFDEKNKYQPQMTFPDDKNDIQYSILHGEQSQQFNQIENTPVQNQLLSTPQNPMKMILSQTDPKPVGNSEEVIRVEVEQPNEEETNHDQEWLKSQDNEDNEYDMKQLMKQQSKTPNSISLQSSSRFKQKQNQQKISQYFRFMEVKPIPDVNRHQILNFCYYSNYHNYGNQLQLTPLIIKYSDYYKKQNLKSAMLVVMGIQLDYSVHEKCDHCFKNTKQKLIDLFSYLDLFKNQMLDSWNISQISNVDQVSVNDFMLKGMMNSHNGVLTEVEFLAAAFEGLVEYYFYETYWLNQQIQQGTIAG